MVCVSVTACSSRFIAARIDRFAVEVPEPLRWQVPYVTEFGALPLYLGWIETIAIRPDGEVVRWSTEGDYEGALPLEDRGWLLPALVTGARRYPELKVLLPAREPGAIDCPCRGHEMFVSGRVICGQCGGLGWLPGVPSGGSPEL